MEETVLIPKLHLLKSEKCKRNFFYFLQEFWSVIIPETPIYNWHIEYLCNELQKVGEKVINREPKDYDLIINISPGETKSTIATVMFPVWCWINDPSIRSLTASYSSSLSTDHSIKSRDIIRSDKFKLYFPEIELKKDQDGKTHYKNTEGGERYATSVTGSVTGFHAHVIIVDDPLNPKEAASDVERERANEFMDVTLSTRKVNKSVTPTILIMQRLHQMDCTGNWLQKDKKIKHICLPGELSKDVKPPELKKNYVDGLMNPERLNHNDLQELRTNLGSYGYSGQIMQTPTPLDGGIWQKWIIPVPDSVMDARLLEAKNRGNDWDLAYTEKQTNSASAYIDSFMYESKMQINDFGFKWLEFPALINWMLTKYKTHYIEAKASGKSAKQTLTSKGIPAIEVKVDGGDKVARAMLATPFAEAGMVECRASILQSLYHDDKQGILIFPNGEHDDLQDVLCQGINRHFIRNTEVKVY